MEYPPRLDAGSPLLRPRLALLAALLDDWALPFDERRGRRGSGLTFPKWMITDDFDDDRPVLRRSRSTWATWPSSSVEDDEDVQEDSGEGSLVPWWSRRAVRSRPRSWAPGRPRTQDELREARRRYFEPQHRRESEDEPATHRSPQRVAFEEFRDVPIRSGAARRSSPPARTSFLREVPVTRERTGREVPDLKDDRVSTDFPATRDVPVSRDCTASRDAPVSRNIPISREAPANKEAHARKDIPVTRELPVSRDIPVTRDFTAVGTAPVSRDVPVTRDFTAVGTAPVSRDIPVTRDFTAVGTAPVSRDVPTADVPARVRNIPVEREVSDPKNPGNPSMKTMITFEGSFLQ
ncbi:serine/arginine repetitive matrix protein 2-like [Frankliniella occidentalis]|uniref:Serine/arginine repetitive matrix protein 2-like n=1 Tax=Frankliniella occidentalis TaxID=133901 RepID=A0A9C6U266_FRAOC|nr:serine/arginine repetitive matrix protein 2-like [Frankliniella occidentalis]